MLSLNTTQKRRFLVAALFIVPLALFALIREQLSWRPRVLGKMKHPVIALAWSPDGKWLASGEGDPFLLYWDSKTNVSVSLWE